ncbi:hypothetical protein [Anaeromyxobacter diazotrophicus]|uniref:Oligosaccharide repeat unit polymerase n=1 Tax=Anaeromyxobacter diazotrophicus TaxID=2590199 RepID=A0A7I9VP33_9BACT|nr:hypothetical protein [Anaeromyxobacter diazotrophicus]GEJ58163.1 hypothetical protein AMYX_29040 [Anaeromyxobacter diazotrophicus]
MAHQVGSSGIIAAPAGGAARPRLPGMWAPFLLTIAAVGALCAYALLLVASSSRGAEMPVAAPFAAGAFAFFQLIFPATRPRRDHVLSPLNWAVLAFFLQLVAMPLMISCVGMSRGTLPYLPSAPAVEKSLLLSILAFGAFSGGYAFLERGGRGAGARESARLRLPRLLVAAYVVMGVAGILLRFGSFGAMFATLGDPEKFWSGTPATETTLADAASTFLRPFLIGGIVMAWCAWIEQRGARASRLARLLASALAAAAMILVGATYAFNRGSFVVPLVALAAAYSFHVRRLSMGALVSMALLLLGLSAVFGQYRRGEATPAELLEGGGQRENVLPKDPLGEVQVYGSAPQFAGFLLEAGERGERRFSPRVLLGSLMYPVPVLGKPFREESGPVIFNRLIYRESDIVDQIIPFQAEVWLSLGPVGLLAAFLLLGALLARLQRAFDAAQTTFDSYAIQFTAIWATFLIQGSLAVVSQVFVYFALPIYGYMLVRRWLRRWEPDEESPTVGLASLPASR